LREEFRWIDGILWQQKDPWPSYRIVGLPVESTTSLSFAGPNLDIAFVTSMTRAVRGVKPKEREAGALFAVHGLGVGACRSRGLPAEAPR
jgi:sugar lactone lactonase YvrE